MDASCSAGCPPVPPRRSMFLVPFGELRNPRRKKIFPPHSGLYLCALFLGLSTSAHTVLVLRVLQESGAMTFGTGSPSSLRFPRAKGKAWVQRDAVYLGCLSGLSWRIPDRALGMEEHLSGHVPSAVGPGPDLLELMGNGRRPGREV